MYIFFWFFKQLFYTLRRFTKHKFLLLLVFFVLAIFLFIRPQFASTPTTIYSIKYNNITYTFTEPLTLTNQNGSYYILINDTLDTVTVVEPYTSNHTLVTYCNLTSSNYSSITNLNLLRGYYNNSLYNVYYYTSTYDSNSDTWSNWVQNSSSSFAINGSNISYNYVKGNNTYLYTKLVDSNVYSLLDNTNLPEGISFLDNIAIWAKKNVLYLLYTSNNDNYFSFDSSAYQYWCKTANNTGGLMDIYTYNTSTHVWTKTASDKSSISMGNATTTYFWYSSNKLMYRSTFYNNNYNNYTTNNNFFNYLYTSPEPFIVNSSNIPTWDFNRLLINTDGLTLDLPEGLLGTYTYYLNFNYNEQDVYTIPINDYFLIDEISNINYFSIPQNIITNYLVIRPNSTIWFSITRVDRLNNSDYFDLGTYTLTVSQADADIINENNEKEQLSNINNEQQQTTQAVENLNNTITDSTIEDSSISFPTLNVPDLTRDGLTHIFDSLVLAFCDGDPEDIIVPIPYTNKSFTIPYNYTYNMLNTYAPLLLNFIRLYWWYKIASIIAIDVYDKMDKLQSGDVEHVQNENVTTNML